MDAFNSFCASPTKLHELLGEDDDGILTSSLETLAYSIRNPDLQLQCNNLKTWVQTRVDERLQRFDTARRRNHVEEMQLHAAYVCRHRKGLDLLCDFVARLALRPLVSAAKAPPSKDDVGLLFEQISLSMSEGKSTIVLATLEPKATQKLVDRMIHLTLGDETGLKALIQTWFPPLQSPPPGIALERVELLSRTKANLDKLFEEVLGLTDSDVNDLKVRTQRLFDPITNDYYALEISLLENRFKSEAPELPVEGCEIIDLERFMLGPAKTFISQFLSHTESAYARSSTLLSDDALEICLETLASCASGRIIDQIVVPCCNLSLAFFPDASSSSSLSRSSYDTPSHQLLRRASSLQNVISKSQGDDDAPSSSSSSKRLMFEERNRYLAQILIPFVERCCDALEATHHFCEPGSAVYSLVQRKVVLAEDVLEQIVARTVDNAFSLAGAFCVPRREVDFDKIDEDESLSQIIETLQFAAEHLRSLGEGALANLVISAKELVLLRVGAIKKPLSPSGGQILAKELNRVAARLEAIFGGIESLENRVYVGRVCSEIRQLAHAFVLPKEEVIRGSVVMDKISKELAQECLSKRLY